MRSSGSSSEEGCLADGDTHSYDAEVERAWRGEKSWNETWAQLRKSLRKAGRQAVKDYLAFPLLAGPAVLPVLLGNLTANVALAPRVHPLRTFWSPCTTGSLPRQTASGWKRVLRLALPGPTPAVAGRATAELESAPRQVIGDQPTI